MKTPVVVILLIIVALVAFACGAIVFKGGAQDGSLSGLAMENGQTEQGTKPQNGQGQSKELKEACNEFFTDNDKLKKVSTGEDANCPWHISGIEVGKWGNGKLKDSIWAHGSFPIPPGVSERPTWFINGQSVGHSQIFFNLRRIPYGSGYLNKGSNTVTVKFLKPPYAGASNSITFDFDPDKIGPGQHKVFK